MKKSLFLICMLLNPVTGLASGKGNNNSSVTEKVEQNIPVVPGDETSLHHENKSTKRLLLQHQVAEIQKMKSKEGLILFLGVNNGEEDLSERFHSFPEGRTVFADLEHQSPLAGNCLSLDFNNTEHLRFLSISLESQFESIILDDSTFKFTEWYVEHLEFFEKLLMPKGEFIFAPTLDRALDLRLDATTLLEDDEAFRFYISRQVFKPTFDGRMMNALIWPLIKTGYIDKEKLNAKVYSAVFRDNWSQVLTRVFPAESISIEKETENFPVISHYRKVFPLVIRCRK